MGSESMWGGVLGGALLVLVLLLLFKAQRFWFVRAWRLTGRVHPPVLRWALRGVWFAALAAVVWPLVVWMLGLPRSRYPFAILGMWLVSALFSWAGVQTVAGIERAWNWLRGHVAKARARLPVRPAKPDARVGRTHEPLPIPSRRYLFQAAAAAVGVTPFAVSLYGYFGERLRYVVERVEIPIPNLPDGLDGLRIAQLSDIHIGSYLPRQQVRRAVEMANGLGADLTVVTGDFLTGPGDPLEECIEELSALRAPLGVWGCNGNHEIYARCQTRAAELFQQGGMRLLRQENAEIMHRGQPLNLIGVDYQRTRAIDGPRLPMLAGAQRLVRPEVLNILLSHNPNAFPKAAEMGIHLTLAGHTHGGQVQVEILDHRLSPARFMTDFVAGLYHRDGASLYVNRGIGTVGTPVRFGAPPEITLLTLRRG